MSWWNFFWRKKDRVPPCVFQFDGVGKMALGTVTIPLLHSGKDVSGNPEVFGVARGKLYMNPGKVAVPQATFSAFTGTAPTLHTVCSASDVDFTSGVNTFEVTAVDAAGNESASFVPTIAVVDQKAPAAFASDGQATFVPK